MGTCLIKLCFLLSLELISGGLCGDGSRLFSGEPIQSILEGTLSCENKTFIQETSTCEKTKIIHFEQGNVVKAGLNELKNCCL